MMTSKELREMSTEDFAMIDQVTLLSFVNDKELEIAILLAAFGPLRRSEICALTSSDIDGNFIRIEEAVVINKNREWITKQPKTFASYRRIEMPEFVIRKMQGIEGKIIKCTPNALTARFIKARKRAGCPHFRFHDLRHYAASIMHAIGVPDEYILDRGGWGTDSVMKRVYRDVIGIEKRKQTDVINGHFEKITQTPKSHV